MPRPEKMAERQRAASSGQAHNGAEGGMMYLRFGAMILTAMVLMYAVMYMGTFEWGHMQWSESRLFMALAMGGTMGLVMWRWMLNMYKNPRINVAIVAGSVLLLALAVFLDRSQTTVEDDSFVSVMIPHHSMGSPAPSVPSSPMGSLRIGGGD